MALRPLLSLIALFAIAGCGGEKPPADSPGAEGPSAPPGESSPSGADTPAAEGSAASAPETTKEEPPATAAKIDKPKSESTIATLSVSDVDSATLQAEVKKLGWLKETVAAAGGVTGSYEAIRFDIEKGAAKGYVELMRPAAHPGPATGAPTPAPSEQKEAKEKEGAIFYDEGAEVLVVVVVDGKKADAKKLLGQLVKPPKKGAKKPETKKPATPAK